MNLPKMKHNYISVSFGNEDRMESLDLFAYETPQEIASLLRKLADNIDRFKSSKDYRSSSSSIFDGIEFPND